MLQCYKCGGFFKVSIYERHVSFCNGIPKPKKTSRPKKKRKQSKKKELKGKRQRIAYKKACIEYKGSVCENCGYNRCYAALEFHHRVPKNKLFGISTKSLFFDVELSEDIKIELDKCILLCANCHREMHYLD